MAKITGKEDIQAVDYQIQKPITNLPKHSVVLDMFARDKKENVYNIELQRKISEAGKKEFAAMQG